MDAEAHVGIGIKESKEQNEESVPRRDDIYLGNAAHYFRVGLSAIQCIDDSIRKLENVKIRTIMPCGYGRVLRFLCQ